MDQQIPGARSLMNEQGFEYAETDHNDENGKKQQIGIAKKGNTENYQKIDSRVSAGK
jgi:hypothetical protein